MALTQEQKDVVFGTVLGGASLGTENDGRTWRYRAIHKKAHSDYLYHKYEIFKDFCGSPPAYGEVFDERTEKIEKRYYFNTLTGGNFRFFANMFYTYDKKRLPAPKGFESGAPAPLGKWVKHVPKKVELYLTPRAIAYWYMDDGALKWLNRSNAMRICTESFQKDDVARLRKVLFEKYGIVTKQVKKTRDGVYVGDNIAIPEESSAAFRELIKPYLVDCMKSKVSDGNYGHL